MDGVPITNFEKRKEGKRQQNFNVWLRDAKKEKEASCLTKKGESRGIHSFSRMKKEKKSLTREVRYMPGDAALHWRNWGMFP